MACQGAGGNLADKADADGIEHSLKGNVAAFLDALQYLLCALAVAGRLVEQLLFRKGIQVCRIADEALVEVFVHGLGAQRLYVHGLAADEMFYASHDEGRAGGVVGAIVCRLTGNAYQRCAACGAVVHETDRKSAFGRKAFGSHCHNLGDDFATFFHQYLIAHVKVEALYDIGIVQGGTANGGACQLYGIHDGHWSDGAGASYLIDDISQCGAGLFCLELIGYGPTRAFGRHAQALLLLKGVYLEHNTIRGNG